MFAIIFCIASRIIGYSVFFSAFSYFTEDILTFFLMFGLADLVLIGGAALSSGERWYKPTFTTTGSAIIGWIIYILLVPFFYVVMDCWMILKLALSFVFCRGRSSSGGSGRSSGGGGRSTSGGSIGAGSSHYGGNRTRGGESAFNKALRRICSQYSGSDYVGSCTRVEYTYSSFVFSHSITLTLNMTFYVQGSRISSESDARYERSCIDNYVSGFNTSSIQNEISSALDKLRQQYDDLDDAWGIKINGNTEIKTV